MTFIPYDSTALYRRSTHDLAFDDLLCFHPTRTLYCGEVKQIQIDELLLFVQVAERLSWRPSPGVMALVPVPGTCIHYRSSSQPKVGSRKEAQRSALRESLRKVIGAPVLRTYSHLFGP